MADTEKLSTIEEWIEQANALIKEQTPRVTFQNEMRDRFLLQTSGDFKNKPDWVKELRDTTPFTSVITCVNILSTGEPHFTFEIPDEAMPGAQTTEPSPQNPEELPAMFGAHIPPPLEALALPGQEQQKTAAEDMGDQLETMMRQSLNASDKRQDTSLQRELALAGFLYSKPILKIADTRMNALYQQQDNVLDLLRGRPPFNYKACAPQSIFDERDAYGLAFVLHRYLRPLREVKRLYPGAKISQEFKDNTLGANCVWCEGWKRDGWCVWIQATTQELAVDQTQNTDKLIVIQPPKKNTLGFIPFAMRTARGTRLFEKSDEQLFPLLYAGTQSETFKRMNLFLTVASTLAFGMANPQWVEESASPEASTTKFNFNEPTILKVATGTKFTNLSMALNHDLMQMVQFIQQQEQQATIPPALSGQIPGGWGNSAASWLNMVIQQGKLEVVPVQVSVGETYEQAAEITLDYLRWFAKRQLGKQGQLEFYVGKKKRVLAVDQLPTYVDIKCELKADLPQDRKLNFDIALAAWKDLFVDHETALDIAGVEDKNKVNERIKAEKAERRQEQLSQQQPNVGPNVTPSSPGAANPAPMLPPGGVDQNPQPPELGAEAMAQSVENMNEIPQ